VTVLLIEEMGVRHLASPSRVSSCIAITNVTYSVKHA
jgi:hypothetical protein